MNTLVPRAQPCSCGRAVDCSDRPWGWWDLADRTTLRASDKEAAPLLLSSRQRALFEVLVAYAMYNPVSILENPSWALFPGYPSSSVLSQRAMAGLLGVLPSMPERAGAGARFMATLDPTLGSGRRSCAFLVSCNLCPRSLPCGGCSLEYQCFTRMGKLCHFAVLITVKSGYS